jgi:hypothetical protein
VDLSSALNAVAEASAKTRVHRYRIARHHARLTRARQAPLFG